jgi:uncharacterized protein (TIGR03437 family)
MTRLLRLSIVLLCSSASLYGAGVTLPTSLRLAGPLDSSVSQLGDEFYNFPSIYKGRAHPGSAYLSGWVEIVFSAPEGKKARFTLTYMSLGTSDAIEFPGGQQYSLINNRAIDNSLIVNKGVLDLTTGAISDLQIHAIFQNSTIARVTRNIRIPFGFLNDYPPNDLPLDLPFTDKPSIKTDGKFIADSSGKITGFEFHGETIPPVTLFPRRALFPPYSFGDNGRFYFANPIGCIAGTAAASCPNDQTNPDGLLLDKNAFFHPHFDLVSKELREVPVSETVPPTLPVALGSTNGMVVSGGKLYVPGGTDGANFSREIQVYDPKTNQWGSGSAIPYPVASSQSAAIGSRVLVAGGWSAATAQPTNLLQVYDTASNRWSLAASGPVAVSGAAAAAVDDKLVLVGGWTADGSGGLFASNLVQLYDPSTDTWRMGAAAPVATAGSTAIVVGATVYLVNGRTADDSITSGVWIYDVRADSWRSGPATPVGVWQASGGLVENRLYVYGGRRSADGPSENVLQILEIARNEWRMGWEGPIPTAGGTGAVLDGRLYLAGGRVQTGEDAAPGTATDLVQVLYPSRGWTISDSHPAFTSASIMNAASGTVGPLDLSPGSRAVIEGYNFSAASDTAPHLRFEGGLTTDLPLELSGIRVWVDGKAAPILSVSPRLIEFQIPWSVSGSVRLPRRVPLEIVKKGSPVQAPGTEVGIRATSPGIYLINFGEYHDPGYLVGATAQARNRDGKTNHPSQPAKRGETVRILATGLGLVFPTPRAGERASANPENEPGLPVTVTVGGKEAAATASLVPNELGMYYVSVTIPSDCPLANNVPVEIAVGGVVSNRASISVR